jgi:hypothetical protein
MKNKILIIHKGQFDTFPPLLSVKKALNDLGYSVDVLTTSNSNKNLFNNEEHCFIIPRSGRIPMISFVFWYFRYLLMINTLVKRNYEFIWIEGGDTLALFGAFIKVKSKDKFIVQVSELYDKLPIYKFMIGKVIIRFGKIVMPEINRAYIYKVWFSLDKLPYVLPNKPYYKTETKEKKALRDLKIMEDKIQQFANGRKIILYQGVIATDRKFSGVVDFVANDDDFCLILLGRDNGYLTELTADTDNVFYAGFISPPLHLEITKLAFICLMAYDTTSLNKIYCAPNKIWEYSMTGKPILSQDLPGIDSLFNKYNFGQCCDVNDVRSVKAAIQMLSNDYEEKCTNATFFSESFDYLNNLNLILTE